MTGKRRKSAQTVQVWSGITCQYILCLLLACRAGAQTPWDGRPWWASDDSYRAPSGTRFPVAASYNYIYYISSNNTIRGRAWRERGLRVWESRPIAGISSRLPVLSVDHTPGSTADMVYYLNSVDGRVYAYQADRNQTTSWTWRSAYCSKQRGLEQQLLTVDSAAGRVVARCGKSLGLFNASTGATLGWVRNHTVSDRILPVPQPNASSIVTWSRNTLHAWSTASGSVGASLWQLRLSSKLTITSAAAGSNLLVVTAKGSNSVFLVSSAGKLVSKYTCSLGRGASTSGILTRPTVVGSTLFMVVLGKANKTAAWSLQALDVTKPSKPRLLFRQAPQRGAPPPQPLTYSKQYIYVSIPQDQRFNGYNMTTGEFVWGNAFDYYPPNWVKQGLITTPYCCDMMWISNIQVANPGQPAQPPTLAPIVAILYTYLGQPPVRPDQCYCTV